MNPLKSNNLEFHDIKEYIDFEKILKITVFQNLNFFSMIYIKKFHSDSYWRWAEAPCALFYFPRVSFVLYPNLTPRVSLIAPITAKFSPRKIIHQPWRIVLKEIACQQVNPLKLFFIAHLSSVLPAAHVLNSKAIESV